MKSIDLVQLKYAFKLSQVNKMLFGNIYGKFKIPEYTLYDYKYLFMYVSYLKISSP